MSMCECRMLRQITQLMVKRETMRRCQVSRVLVVCSKQLAKGQPSAANKALFSRFKVRDCSLGIHKSKISWKEKKVFCAARPKLR